MARTTRSTKSAASTGSGTPAAAKASGKKYTVTPAENARRMFILPKKVTKDARIVTLPNPRSQKPTRYLACPETGLYEFVTVESEEPRSWLLETKGEGKGVDGVKQKVEEEDDTEKETKEDTEDVKPETTDASSPVPIPTTAPTGNITIISTPTLYIATPIDPVFLLISTLYQPLSAGEKRRFLSADDHFDDLPATTSHLQTLLRWGTLRPLWESRLGAISNTADLAGERMFCLDDDKLLECILEKAKALADGGLPKSMEDKFVTKVLEQPMVFQTLAPGASIDESGNLATPESATPALITTGTPTDSPAIPSTPSAGGPTFLTAQPPPAILSLQRLAVAFNYICAAYIPAATETTLRAALAIKVDFGPLDEYLGTLSQSRAEATAARNVDMSRKHPLEDAEDRVAEKKRKADEEMKQKKLVTRGLKNLQKVNTTGMKKMTSFFKKT